MVAVVTGDREVRRALQQMRQSVQTRITKSAQRTALAELAKGIKGKLPGRYKDARRGIGHSLKRGRSLLIEGKAGVAVGIRGARREKMLSRARASSGLRSQGGAKGVGIGWNNLQWFIMGTKERRLRKGSDLGPKAGHSTGAMKYDTAVRDVIARAWSSGRLTFGKTMQKRMADLVNREATKLAVKAKLK